MAAEKMLLKSYRVYLPEIIQTSSLDRLQKKSLERNDCLYVASASELRVRKPLTENVPSSQNYIQTNCLSVISMLLEALEQHKDNLFETNFVNLRHVFVHWVK